MARTGKPAVRHIDAVARAAIVLDALADTPVELGTSEIARTTGINASTVSRLLSTLAAAGLVQYVPATGRYRLGMRVLRLAGAARANLEIRTLARPYLDELTDITGETSTLSLPGTHDVLTVDFAQSDISVRSVASVGRNSVAHATSVGKVFLAWGGKLPSGKLTAYTSRTVTDRKVLAREIDRVRQRGWAQALREREEDLNGVAAPVLNGTGRLVAILGVQGPSSRFGRRAIHDATAPLLARTRLLTSVA